MSSLPQREAGMDDRELHEILAKLAWEDGCHRCTAEDIAKPDMAPFIRVKVSVAIEAMRQIALRNPDA